MITILDHTTQHITVYPEKVIRARAEACPGENCQADPSQHHTCIVKAEDDGKIVCCGSHGGSYDYADCSCTDIQQCEHKTALVERLQTADIDHKERARERALGALRGA